ncbi:caspase-8 isoform X1 [Salmo salar]|uniref:Caspase-8-like isoform X1 n=1 Tax=Salmo salar TaxID=8030 RepID=A0A1S3PMB3_SALSA|nr:caspase-8-like isoform X1 [Salmo salar]XP_014028797.2 caspase-8-like isoform X1 [Salmo salar]
MDFQRLLLQVEQALSSEEVQALAFLCKDLLDKDLNSVTTASKLFSLLMDQELLSPDQPYLLADLLLTIQRNSLMRGLGLNNQLPTTSSLISPYRKLLYNLSENITTDELREIKFLLSNELPRRKLEDNLTTLQLFLEMEKIDILSIIKLNTLESIFGIVCPMLKTTIKKYKTQNSLAGPGTQETGVGQFRPRSVSVSEAHPGIQAASMLPKRTVFCELSVEQYSHSDETLIPPTYFSSSQPSAKVSCLNRSDTSLADVRRVSYSMDAVLSHGLSLLSTNGDNCAALIKEYHHVSSTSSCGDNKNFGPADPQTGNTKREELGEYSMTGKKRGFCLIINNNDFRNSPQLLKEREGTHIDKKSLVSVFNWLGFETQTEPDCSREKILSLLVELSKRDHSQMDCLVCCVLSHGLEGGVYGVDGLEVSVRELTKPFSGLECSSLRDKPKLFFIQACQGNKDQKQVFIQSDGPGPSSTTTSSICTDAVVHRDSIPTDADFLLGMATVPHFASFRDKKLGTWFIQSLCQNLINLVPSGYDLLSILTKVNDDVSRKTNGIKKQMPQPAYSLRKRVVFPIPKEPPPKL